MQRKKIPKSKEKIDVIISSQEIGENASLPMVINPTVINPTEVSGPIRVLGVYLIVINYFWCIGWELGKRRFWMFSADFFFGCYMKWDWMLRKIRKKLIC